MRRLLVVVVFAVSGLWAMPAFAEDPPPFTPVGPDRPVPGPFVQVGEDRPDPVPAEAAPPVEVPPAFTG